MTALEAESTAISELLMFSDPFTKTLGASIRMSPRSKDDEDDRVDRE